MGHPGKIKLEKKKDQFRSKYQELGFLINLTTKQLHKMESKLIFLSYFPLHKAELFFSFLIINYILLEQTDSEQLIKGQTG